MPAFPPRYWIKSALAVALIVLADAMLFDERPGLGLAIFAAAWTAAVAVAIPAARRSRLSFLALGSAAVFAAVQLERPTLVGWLLFGISLGVAALGVRAPLGQDAWQWGQRLVVGAATGLAGPFLDVRRLLKARARSRPLKLMTMLLAAMLPVWGSALFLWLFAMANPVIGRAIEKLQLPEIDAARAIFWTITGVAIWAALRPRGLRKPLRTPGIEGDVVFAGATPTSIAISLVAFNVLFALQNGLDVAFLWSGAGLPEGVTFADYSHRGAYTLIATALLAGLLVLIFLRPGSKTAASPAIRLLVVVWIAQNVFLTVSTALRIIDYVEVYSLTRLRIAALLWVGLVALGLVLIGWRLLKARSSSWLINANVLAAGLVLAGCSVVDLGAVAAAWNVRHAREVGGAGTSLDLCYLRSLNGAAIVSLAELERRPLTPDFRDRVAFVRRDLTAQVQSQQVRFQSWRWRDARRMARVRGLTGEPVLRPVQLGRGCDGALPPPPPPRPPLTPSANPGT